MKKTNADRARELIRWLGDGDETHPRGDLQRRFTAALNAAEKRGKKMARDEIAQGLRCVDGTCGHVLAILADRDKHAEAMARVAGLG